MNNYIETYECSFCKEIKNITEFYHKNNSRLCQKCHGEKIELEKQSKKCCSQCKKIKNSLAFFKGYSECKECQYENQRTNRNTKIKTCKNFVQF